MSWSTFWYVKAALAWSLSAWGALDWGSEHEPRYLFVLAAAVALSAVSSARVAKDRGRRQAYEAGWEARDTIGRQRSDVHELRLHK